MPTPLETSQESENPLAGEVSTNYEQLVLPLDVRPIRYVYWLHATIERRRAKILCTKGRLALITDSLTSSPMSTNIAADTIPELADPNLRYALRFADAAKAVGWKEEGPGMYSGHSVTVLATDEGMNSKLLSATYTGISRGEHDTFLDNLLQLGSCTSYG